MEHPIYKFQQDNADAIEKVLAEYRGTEAWNTAQKAFYKIVRSFIHGGMEEMPDEELNKHFERAITTTEEDITTYLDLSNAALKTEKDVNSDYYLTNVAHHRHDKYFATNQSCPITGQGNGDKTLYARFDAQNLYKRYPVNATSSMPERVKESPFPTWDSIVKAMTDRATFDATFDLTHKEQADMVFAVTSEIDWAKEDGYLFMTPPLFAGTVFSPALYSVYFFGPNNNIYFFVTADGQGNPQAPFVGLVHDAKSQDEIVYYSVNRYAFSYLSNAANPARYWMTMHDENLLDYTLNIETFFPDHTNSPYIEVNANFSAQVSPEKIKYFTHVPGLSTIMIIQKGTLMKDLIAAYFPDKTSVELWKAVGAITGDNKWLNALKNIGLNAMSDIFASHVWLEKPTVVAS